MRFLLRTIVFSLAVVSAAHGQVLRSFQLAPPPMSDLPPSNLINELVAQNDTLWVGTENGLARLRMQGASWDVFGSTAPFDGKGVSAFAGNDAVLWTAVAYSIDQQDERIPSGGGLYFSLDRGQNWTFVAQPVDEGLVDTITTYGATGIRSLAITTTANNLTYDLAVTSDGVWTANFAGMLRRSTDLGTTWQKVVLPPDGEPSFIRSTDTLNFDLAPTSGKAGLTGNLNHRVFSVHVTSDSVIWVGTAGGINKTTDGGQSWRRFSRQNQTESISGNFVVAIREQFWNGRRIVWAATVNAESSEEQRGVSYSDDGGEHWKRTLLGEFAHNIAIRDSIVYITTDNGLYRTNDFGETWIRTGSITDPLNGHRFNSTTLYGVAVLGDTVWIGGPEGIASTVDSPASPFGSRWSIFRTYARSTSPSEAYSYPSPFAPDDEAVRIHYRTPGTGLTRVSIRIFDFAMAPVRTLLNDAVRTAGTEHDDLWDGRTDGGALVANGVYFFQIEFEGHDPVWGKIFAIK